VKWALILSRQHAAKWGALWRVVTPALRVGSTDGRFLPYQHHGYQAFTRMSRFPSRPLSQCRWDIRRRAGVPRLGHSGTIDILGADPARDAAVANYRPTGNQIRSRGRRRCPDWIRLVEATDSVATSSTATTVGVLVTGSGSVGNTISGNSIYSNARLGIQLALGGKIPDPTASLLSYSP